MYTEVKYIKSHGHANVTQLTPACFPQKMIIESAILSNLIC